MKQPWCRSGIAMTAIALLSGIFLSGCYSPSEIHPAAASGKKVKIPGRMLEKLASAQKQTSARGFDYPWKGLEKHIAKDKSGRLLLVGYGSLINLESSSETIRGVNAKDFFPVVAVGAKRVFNYRIPADVLRELGGKAKPDEIAALNVVATGRVTDVINGRILPISASDLPALRKREYGYHLRPVTCIRWDDPGAEPFTAYVLCAEDPVVQGRRVIDNAIKPNPAYVEICHSGAASVSKAFGDLFLETSFLADGKTSLRQLEQAGP
ncbi:MAG: hypothetical protein ACOYM3_08235 [Terrimicrobiaceae bacterium]